MTIRNTLSCKSDLSLILNIKPYKSSFSKNIEENYTYFSFLRKDQSSKNYNWNSQTFFCSENFSEKKLVLVAEVFKSLDGPIHLAEFSMIKMLNPYCANNLLNWYNN